MPRETWSIDKLQEAASKFTNRTDFARGHPAAYSAAAKRKLLDDVCGHMIAKQAARYTDEEIHTIARNFAHVADFRAAHPSHCQAAYSRGIAASVTAHMTVKKPQIDYPTYFADKWADHFTLLSEYKSSRERIIVQCLTCKETWETIPFRIRCQFCGYNSLTDDQHRKMIQTIHDGRIEPIEIYRNKTTKLTYRCNTGHEWSALPANVLAGSGCPSCAACGFSKPEHALGNQIEAMGCDVQRNARGIIGRYELDIYIPTHNLAIEFNGTYWHSRHPANYHLTKTEKCEAIGVRLIHIWEHEQNNQIMQSIIRAALGRFERTIHARKCSVVTVDWRTAAIFLNDNHIQGAGSPSAINLALVADGETVAVITFGKPRFETARDWELIRYAAKRDTRIIGGAAKLFKRRPSGSIVTYSDRRLFDGALYGRLGFTRDHASAPGYFYIGKDGATISRYQAQRKNLPKLIGAQFDPTLSEAENMTIAGYKKMFDCGTVRWIYA